MQTALAKLIERHLAKQHLSRVQLATALQITPVSVSRWLRTEGDAPVPWRHYPGLARALRVPLARVLQAAEADYPAHVQMFHQFFGRIPTRLTG